MSNEILFQHTAARRRLANHCAAAYKARLFQHTAARRRLVDSAIFLLMCFGFQHTAARRRLDLISPEHPSSSSFQHTAARRRLGRPHHLIQRAASFNTQPPEGGWESLFNKCRLTLVSTHSRPKAAGGASVVIVENYHVSTHSRPKAAGIRA